MYISHIPTVPAMNMIEREAPSTAERQALIDTEHVLALGRGSLVHVDHETGQIVESEQYYAQSRRDQISGELGVWITKDAAQAEYAAAQQA